MENNIKHAIILAATIIANIYFYAGASRIYSHSFNPKDFNLIINSDGKLEITSELEDAFYEDSSQPMIPYIEVSYAIGYDERIANLKYSVTRKEITKNIELASNPPTIPMDGVTYSISTQKYEDRIYPENIVEHVYTQSWDGLKVASFKFSPFEYDAPNKTLYFISAITMDIQTEKCSVKEYSYRLGSSQTVPSIVKSIVVNNNEVDSLIAISTSHEPIKSSSTGISDQVDYLIITSSELANAFEPLRKWRQVTGLKSLTVTTDEIYNIYDGHKFYKTPQLKIKAFIKDLYQNNGLTYVLLGGDDSIVPAQPCYCDYTMEDGTYYVDSNIASDMFYQDVTTDTFWDGNNNGRVGEAEDYISNSISVLISRLPVKTIEDVQSVTERIISYQKSPKWKGEFLFAGTKLTNNPNDEVQNDAELQSKREHYIYIRNKIPCDSISFFDSWTSFERGKDFDVTPTNMLSVLANGYDFVSMISHGDYDSWKMESGGNFKSQHGLSISNPGYTIVITPACRTNGFQCSKTDYPYGSLGESLILNPNSGIVAFWGSSSITWGHTGTKTPGHNVDFTFRILRSLNGNFNITKSWGLACAYPRFYGIDYKSHTRHWNRLGFNGLGDPAMPVYVDVPKTFPLNSVQLNRTTLNVNTNESDVKVCVMSSEDNGDSFYEVHQGNVSLENFPISGSVCITRENYIPLVHSYSYIQNTTIDTDRTYECDEVIIGSDVISSSPKGEVICAGGKTEIKAKNVTIKNGFTVKKGAEFRIEKGQ